jgi:hypothetical protein
MRLALVLIVVCAFLAGCSSETEQKVTVGPAQVEMPKLPGMADVTVLRCSHANSTIELKNTASGAIPEGVDFKVIRNDAAGGLVGEVDFDRELAAGASLQYKILNGSANATLLLGIPYTLNYPGIPAKTFTCS